MTVSVYSGEYANVTRTVKVGNKCQLRKTQSKGVFHWCLVELRSKRGKVVTLVIDGHPVKVPLLNSVVFEWAASNGIRYDIEFYVGRSHGADAVSVTVHAPRIIGVQWDGFIGALRAGL